MVAFIDDHRLKFGVEPICGVLPIAPSVYYEHKLWQRAPERRPARAQRDDGLCEHVRRVWNKSRSNGAARAEERKVAPNPSARRPVQPFVIAVASSACCPFPRRLACAHSSASA